jgi:thiol-disulfide isomerase/thioredoxin
MADSPQVNNEESTKAGQLQNEVLAPSSNHTIAVEFYASWCAICPEFEPALQ